MRVPSQVDLVSEFVQFAAADGAGKTLRGQVGKQRVVGALTAADDWGKNLELGAVGKFEDSVDNLLRGLALNDGPIDRAMWNADAGIEQTEVVVDLGNGSDGGTRVAGGRLLINGDRGRKTLNEVDIGFVHLTEELTGIGRQRLDVAALAFGVDRVECKR